jgi:hypothetical protein
MDRSKFLLETEKIKVLIFNICVVLYILRSEYPSNRSLDDMMLSIIISDS